MAPHLIREWDKKVGAGLVQIYGTTEMGPCMSVLYPHEQLSHAGSAGLPSLNHDLLVARVKADGSPFGPPPTWRRRTRWAKSWCGGPA